MNNLFSFILAKHIKYNTNSLDTKKAVNDNTLGDFYIDFTYSEQYEHVQTTDQWDVHITDTTFNPTEHL